MFFVVCCMSCLVVFLDSLLLGEMSSSMNKTYCFSEPTLFMVRHDGKDRHQRNSALKALHSTLRSLPLTILWDISYYFCSETLRMFNPITSSHDECVCRNLGIVHTLRFSSVHYLGVVFGLLRGSVFVEKTGGVIDLMFGFEGKKHF